VFAAFNALHQAIQSGSDAKRYLDTHTFNSVCGAYRFDQNGDVVGDRLRYVLKTISRGKVKEL
jgi:ABC-type branched-subunit amino acid transport system substrate-binding protein